jgi:hypothetical protein
MGLFDRGSKGPAAVAEREADAPVVEVVPGSVVAYLKPGAFNGVVGPRIVTEFDSFRHAKQGTLLRTNTLKLFLSAHAADAAVQEARATFKAAAERAEQNAAELARVQAVQAACEHADVVQCQGITIPAEVWRHVPGTARRKLAADGTVQPVTVEAEA